MEPVTKTIGHNKKETRKQVFWEQRIFYKKNFLLVLWHLFSSGFDINENQICYLKHLKLPWSMAIAFQ